MLDKFKDATKISDFAKDKISTAVGLNIVRGYEDNQFKPKTQITKEQTAAVIYRLLEALKVF